MKEVKITGSTSVKEGETLNLSCSVESFPPSIITWMKFSDENIQNGTESSLQDGILSDLHNSTVSELQEQRGWGTFFISNMTVENSGQYICSAKHLNNTLVRKVDINVICKYKFNSSEHFLYYFYLMRCILKYMIRMTGRSFTILWLPPVVVLGKIVN